MNRNSRIQIGSLGAGRVISWESEIFRFQSEVKITEEVK